MSTDPGVTAKRDAGTMAVFNNEISGNGNGRVVRGVTGLELLEDAAPDILEQTLQYCRNTDGQGRIYVKFLDDSTYELYKDKSLSAESKVGVGATGKAVSACNNSGLEGFMLHLTGKDLSEHQGVYLAFGGIEGRSLNDGGDAGVVYTGNVVGSPADPAGSALFDADSAFMSGVELGKNTSDSGKIYLKNVFDADSGTVQVFAYRDAEMRDADLVAKSEEYFARMPNKAFNANLPEDDVTNPRFLDVENMTIILNEVRNSDNTAGTGLGMVLSYDGKAFAGMDASEVLTGEITFQNLGARIFSQEYGSDAFIRLTQDKGALFSHYDEAGNPESGRLTEAGDNGAIRKVSGQDASISVNGSVYHTNGLRLQVATQDLQADLVFNAGRVGSTTVAQVGYDVGSVFTKAGVLNLGNYELSDTAGGKYEGLSGLLCNAGHNTTETLDDFQGGMQLQLGEGAGDQNRTVIGVKSMTSENLGRVTRGGYWQTGSAVWEERTFRLKDVMGGGAASLREDPTLAMAIIDQAIDDVAGQRARLGAVQSNLLQTNQNNLEVALENITKTESAIRDTDMAQEMAEFTRAQVLQSAAMTMMSNVNQNSRNVLQLLQ